MIFYFNFWINKYFRYINLYNHYSYNVIIKKTTFANKIIKQHSVQFLMSLNKLNAKKG